MKRIPRPKSKKYKRDPTGSKHIDDSMVSILHRIIKNYTSSVLQAVTDHWSRAQKERQLGAIDLLWNQVVAAGANQITPDLMHTVAAEFSEKGYLQGIKFATTAAEQLGFGISLGMGPADQSTLSILINRNTLNLTNMISDLQARIATILEEGYAKGLSVREIRDEIMRATEIAENRAEKIARTEVMNAVNEAAKERYRRLGIVHMEWLTAHDDRVCDLCDPLDYQIYKEKDLPYGGPPVHPNCRCTLAPVVDDESKPINIWDYVEK